MKEAWRAWVTASRFLFWRAIELLSMAVTLHKEAARQATALHPKNPRELFAAGYACFFYDLQWDSWCGAHLNPEERGVVAELKYRCREWDGVPWHRVTFAEYESDGREWRAVPLAYAEQHLRAA